MKQNESMFNSDLTPMFDGAILMNEEAMKDEAVMMALRRAHQDNFEFRSHPSGSWNISDRD